MNIINRLKAIKIVAGMLLLLPAIAIAYVPYPGKIPVTIVDIEAANIIKVNFETWPGFRKDVSIVLPNLVLPGQGENVQECELELAEKAIVFTFNFLSNAADISVKDMEMESSTSEIAISSIYTGRGTLDDALLHEHLARLNTDAADTPWC